MRRIICRGAALAAVLALAGAGVASADTTLGNTTAPSGSTAASCNSGYVLGEPASSSSTPYALSNAGIVKQWSTNVTGATPGADIYLLVLSQSGTSLTVVGVDHETIPNPLPAGGLATFTINSPILAQAGDFLGLYSPDTKDSCGWTAGSTPAGDTVGLIANPGMNPLSGPPTAGGALTLYNTVAGEVNVAAVVAPAIADVAVSASSAPARPSIGALAVLQAKVSNSGPQPSDVAFTDTVPAGLHVVAAESGKGTCSVAGQLVTCTISSLRSGGRLGVSVIVMPQKTGTYTNSVSVSPTTGVKDPNLANNSATATLKVTKGGPTRCTVPVLTATPKGVAEHVLKLLGCRVKVTFKKVPANKSRAVPKGTVLSTDPGRGTYVLNRVITLVVRK